MKKFLTLLLCLVFLFAIGCQPTPDHEPVPNKGDDTLEEVIKTTPVPKTGAPDSNADNSDAPGVTDVPFEIPHLEVPEHWTEEAGDFNGFHVTIDSDVNYSDVAHPVYLVKYEHTLDDNVVKELKKYFIDPTKWRPIGSSREELLATLKAVMRGRPTDDIDPDTGETVYAPYEGQQEDIDRIMKKLQELGEDDGWEEAMEDVPMAQGYFDDGERMVYFARADLSFNMSENEFYYPESEPYAIMENWFNEYGNRERITELPEPAMKKERAIELANEILEKTGLDDHLSIVQVYKAQLGDTRNGDVLGLGWEVICMLDTNGAKIFSFDNYDFNGSLAIGSLGVDEKSFRPPMKNEELKLYFEDDILKYASWHSPQSIVSVENPAVTLLPFDQIMQSFRDRLKYALSYGSEDDPHDLVVDEIALTYLCSMKKDDIDHYYWTPMWGFSYKISNMAPTLPGVLFINALDGTFVAPPVGTVG